MPSLKPMVIRLYYALLFILFFNVANAQTDTNTSFADRMNYIFQSLEKPRVPNGLLLDYAMEFTNLSNFNGAALTDSNKVMTSEFWEIYNTLYLSRIHPNGFTLQNPSVFDSLWFGQRDYGKIVLSGLFYNYARFREDAVQNNLITIQNEQVIDSYVNGIWQDPYFTEKVFAVSPSLEYYEGKNLQVVLPSNLWQTNAAGEVNNISIDFGDGQGYRTLSVGTPLSLNYSDTGSKTWTYRLQLSGGQYLYSHSQVKIKNAITETGCANCRFGATNPETITFTADEAFQGAAANGFITIRYRDADLGLRRPLIVVEGFDAGHITSPELQFGTTTIDDFNENVFFSGSPAINDVILNNFREYDIIYVDWRNGTDFLQRNGLLLETIIRWVNANKEPLPGAGFAQNVILGQSMGGVISRWALRDMETRLAQQHQTRMFISMDAPQQGANVPAAYQHLAKHMRNLYLQTNVWGGVELFQWITGGPSPFRALSIADRPASRQMLINWVNGSGNIDNTMHDQWQTELRNLGYPSQNNIRNIAVSNGAECGTTQPFAPGAELLNINGKANTRFLGDLVGQIAFPLAGVLLGQGGFYLGILPGRNEIKYEFIANAQPQQGASQRIYRGKISYTKRILWLIPVTVTITERNNNNNSSLLPLDYYAGGQINTGVNINDINIQNALVKFNLSFSHIPTFSFIPTPSALDIGLNNVTLNNADYLARYIGGAPPVVPRNSPFQNFVTAFNNQRRNEQHIGFFPRNGDWLAQELTQIDNPPHNPPVANCSAFCENGTIIGNPLICNAQTFTAPFGAGVTYAWVIGDPSLVTPNVVGNTITLTRNPNANGTTTLTVNISGACGSTTLSIPITVGTVFIGTYTISSNYSQPTSRTLGPNNAAIFLPANQSFSVTAYITTPNLSSPSWARAASSYPFNWFSSGTQLNFNGTSGSGAYTQRNGTFEFTGNAGCGLTTASFNWPVITQGWGFRMAATPNPATNNLNVEVMDETPQAKSSGLQQTITMTLYNLTNTLVMKRWIFKTSQPTYNLDVSGIKMGQYVLVVEKGKQQQSQQIAIQ